MIGNTQKTTSYVNNYGSNKKNLPAEQSKTEAITLLPENTTLPGISINNPIFFSPPSTKEVALKKINVDPYPNQNDLKTDDKKFCDEDSSSPLVKNSDAPITAGPYEPFDANDIHEDFGEDPFNAHQNSCDVCKGHLSQTYGQTSGLEAASFSLRELGDFDMSYNLENGNFDQLEELYLAYMYDLKTLGVNIEGEMNPNFVGAIPNTVTCITLGAGIGSEAVAAIPPHIRTVQILRGVAPKVIAALPKHIQRILFGNDITPEVAKSLPGHVKTVGVKDVIEMNTQSLRSEHLRREGIQNVGVTQETIAAIPQHITVEHGGYEIVIRKGKPLTQVISFGSGSTIINNSVTKHALNTNKFKLNINAQTTVLPFVPRAEKRDSLFETKFPSCLKVTSCEAVYSLLSSQIAKGWRWVTPGFINGTSASIIIKAKQIPDLSIDDWIIMEGKTMRLVESKSKDQLTQKLYEKLEEKFLKIAESNAQDVVAQLRDMLVKLSIHEGDDAFIPQHMRKDLIPPICAIYPGELPLNFFEDSYARLAGAYIRHLERLPKLHEAFKRFFEVEEQSQKFSVCVSDFPEAEYDKYSSVKLRKELLTKADLIFIRQALGIKIDVDKLRDRPTIENTLPSKKLLEILTCFDASHHDCPWLISLPIFGLERQFLLSQCGDQLLVSMPTAPNQDGFLKYVGNAYHHWTRHTGIKVGTISSILNNPISGSAVTIPWAHRILEFLVCTQVAEAHCTPNQLGTSRVPGTGKLARAILQNNIIKNTPLSFLFDIANGKEGMFPMAAKYGTGNTRKAVNDLERPYKKARCTDMSEDSEVEG